MRIAQGILILGVCALPLAGCSSTEKAAVLAALGFSGNATAIVGSGSIDTATGETLTTSSASSDPIKGAVITRDDNKTSADPIDDTPADPSDDTLTVTVDGGGLVAGPRTYEFDAAGSLADADNGAYNPSFNEFGFGVFKPTDAPNNSILIAGVGDEGSFAGFVGTNNTTTGVGNIAAAYGGVVAPTIMPTGSLHYYGDSVAVAQKVGETSSFISGDANIEANFVDGTVLGGFYFDRNVPDDFNPTPYVGTLTPGPGGNGIFVGFAGNMSTDKAGYTSTGVAINGLPGSGLVKGGFYGPGYVETAGAIDVQDSRPAGDPDNVGKITGAFIATN